MSKLLTDDMVERAAQAYWSHDEPICALTDRPKFRAALLAILPDIEKAVREECAQIAEDVGGGDYADTKIAERIRALPPSAQGETT
jgi:hypothetical protein